MKKLIAALAAVIAVAGTLFFVYGSGQTSSADTDYLRIHVRANSNSQTDQSIKYIVKDEVVRFITPYAAECKDKQTAMKIIGGILDKIEEVCNRVLRQNGFSYKSKASVREENFPTRVYGDLTLESGLYDALIIELGSGTGDNWWCVIYPPLCFTSGNGKPEYKSAIAEIINKFKNK